MCKPSLNADKFNMLTDDGLTLKVKFKMMFYGCYNLEMDKTRH